MGACNWILTGFDLKHRKLDDFSCFHARSDAIEVARGDPVKIVAKSHHGGSDLR